MSDTEFEPGYTHAHKWVGKSGTDWDGYVVCTVCHAAREMTVTWYETADEECESGDRDPCLNCGHNRTAHALGACHFTPRRGSPVCPCEAFRPAAAARSATEETT